MATDQQSEFATLLGSSQSFRQTAQNAVDKSFDLDLMNVALKRGLGIPNVKISNVTKPLLSISGEISTGLTCHLRDFTVSIHHKKKLESLERIYERTISGSMDVLVKRVISHSADATQVYVAEVTSLNWKCGNSLKSSSGVTSVSGCMSHEILSPNYSADPFVCSSSTYAAKHGVQVRSRKGERISNSDDGMTIVLGGTNQTVLCTGSDVKVFTDGNNSQISATGRGSRIICCGTDGSVSTVGSDSCIQECGRNYGVKTFGPNARIDALGSNSRIISSSSSAHLSFYGGHTEIEANGCDIKDDFGQVFVSAVVKTFSKVFNSTLPTAEGQDAH